MADEHHGGDILGWAKKHPYLAGLLVVGALIIVYVIFSESGSSSSSSSLTGQQQLAALRIQNQPALAAARSQTAQAASGNRAQVAIANSGNLSNTSIARIQAGSANLATSLGYKLGLSNNQNQVTLANIQNQNQVTLANIQKAEAEQMQAAQQADFMAYLQQVLPDYEQQEQSFLGAFQQNGLWETAAGLGYPEPSWLSQAPQVPSYPYE